MNKRTVIQAIIDRIGRASARYLEIGVNTGKTFCNIHAGEKMGVDVKLDVTVPDETSGQSILIESRSDEFFDSWGRFGEGKFDVVFIDGLHTSDQAYRDFINACRNLNAGGAIVLHDCNPLTKAASTRALNQHEANAKMKDNPGWDGTWNGDVWKAVVRLRFCDNYDLFVLNCDQGLGICNNPNPFPHLFHCPLTPSVVAKMGYRELASERSLMLGLRPESYFDEWLNLEYPNKPKNK